MNVITTTAQAADAGLSDPERIAAVLGSFVAGGSMLKVTEMMLGRRKNRADAEKVLTDAMAAVVTSAMSMLEPRDRDMEAMRLRHQQEMKDMRDQHAATTTRLSERIAGLEGQLQVVLAENNQYRTALTLREAAYNTGQTPVVAGE
jgi:hypothetical protein